MKLLILLLLMASQSFAQDCGSPGMKKKLLHYEAFIKGLSKTKNPVKEINRYIQEHGLLLDVSLTETGSKKYPENIEGDLIIGSRAIFLKKLRITTDLSLDTVSEISSPKADKTINSWQIPVNKMVDGVMGNEVIHKTYLRADCFQTSKEVLLAITTEGDFRVIENVSLPEKKPVDCPITKKVYKESGYGGCFELLDLKSKKKRYFLMQYPMT